MSDPYNQPASQQEMDLTDIFSLIGRFFKNIVYFFFRIVDFIIKMWWVILLLIIAGAVLGFVLKDEPSYESNLLLKTNFKSQSYVYTAIEQFNNNLLENDLDFIKSLDKSPESFSIQKVTVAPVVEVLELIDNIGENDRVLGAMTKEFKLDDDRELFATDRFLSKYNYHKLNVDFNSDNHLEDLDALLSYINKNPFAKELKTQGLENHIKFIESQEESIRQVNDLIESYSDENGIINKTEKEGFYFNNRSDNISDLFEVKTELVKDLEEYKNDNVSYTDVAVIVSDVQVFRGPSIFNNIIIIYPIIFVLLFLIFSGVVSLYRSYKRELKATQE